MHRNYIPQVLIKEIKHKLQNELHRSAEPIDLVAAEALLATVTETPGDYSEEFVKELKTFYAELKDFFNAESLTEQLEGLRPFIDEDTQAIIDHFLWKKDSLEKASGANIIKTFLDTMHALTNLLATIVKALDSGIRNEDSNESVTLRQK